MEPSSLGIEPLYTCWIKKLDEMLLTLAKNNAANAQGGAQKDGGNAKQQDPSQAGEKKSHGKKETARQNINKKLTSLLWAK